MMAKRLRAAIAVAGILTVAIVGTLMLNHLLVGRPVDAALREDPRNAGFDLSARFGSYVRFDILVLALRSAEEASPADLWRGVLQSAAALDEHGRSFEAVILARRGPEVFRITGPDFAWLGAEYRMGQNPLYLVRKLPSKLYQPDGSPAYGEWTGGWLGVLGQEMSDVVDAARTWVGPDRAL